MNIPPPTGLDASLSADAQAVVNEAHAAMSSWIDKSINDLASKINAQIEDAAKSLNAQVEQMTQQLNGSRSDLQKNLDDLNQIKSTLNPANLQAAIDQSAAKIKAVQEYLQQREDQWKALGNTIVSVAIGAAKKMAA